MGVSHGDAHILNLKISIGCFYEFQTQISVFISRSSSSNWNFRTPNTVIKSVEVFNLLGKRVASQRNNNSTEASISTQGLSSGIYIARITTEQGAKSVKLIKN